MEKCAIMPTLSLDILESNDEISKKILQALIPQINNFLQNAFNKIKPKLVSIVIEAIKAAPEYNSLLSGQLQAEFGIPDSSSRLNNLLNIWENITFELQQATIKNNEITGGFILNMIKSDYSDVINSDSAIFTTEKGTDLRWLEWLLLFGNKTIIKDYTIILGPNPRSRTGKAIMRGVTSGKWRVPPEFAGYANDNWITRAIDSVDDEINNLLQKNLRV